MIKANIQVDLSGVQSKLESATEAVQEAFAEQVLKDSNFFIPMDTKNLRDSSLIASDFKAGLLVWNAPYARRLYYNPQYNFSKDENPYSSGLWFEMAKSRFISEWVALVEKEYKNNL
ncbi:minor capsid protein [Bacillus toyonensis]|uniref:minor capsid protein n=1 Tax=Bacillus toyonensis TaxID=155322 RepID=UPI0002796133|nr:minor capsid protein [Bacillus toyonensis]EJQ77750.1 hypothetical protein IGO_05728 [Bacillus toyonensis]